MLIPSFLRVAKGDLVQILLSSVCVIKNVGKTCTILHINERDVNMKEVENQLKKLNLAKFHYGLWICKLLLVITVISDIQCQLYINVSN